MASIIQFFHKKTPGEWVSLDTLNRRRLMPTGSAINDGFMMLSFALPVARNATAEEAAKKYVEKIGFSEAQVFHSQALADSFTLFQVWAKAKPAFDFTKIKADAESSRDPEPFIEKIRTVLKRRFHILGIAADAPSTLKLELLLNKKGNGSAPGLEQYPALKVSYLRTWDGLEDLQKKILLLAPDVVLVFKEKSTATKSLAVRDVEQLQQFSQSFKSNKRAGNAPTKGLILSGVPSVKADKFGFDFGFTGDVSSLEILQFIAQKLLKNSK